MTSVSPASVSHGFFSVEVPPTPNPIPVTHLHFYYEYCASSHSAGGMKMKTWVQLAEDDTKSFPRKLWAALPISNHALFQGKTSAQAALAFIRVNHIDSQQMQTMKEQVLLTKIHVTHTQLLQAWPHSMLFHCAPMAHEQERTLTSSSLQSKHSHDNQRRRRAKFNA